MSRSQPSILDAAVFAPPTVSNPASPEKAVGRAEKPLPPLPAKQLRRRASTAAKQTTSVGAAVSVDASPQLRAISGTAATQFLPPSMPARHASVAFVDPRLAYEGSPQFKTFLEELDDSNKRFAGALRRIASLAKKANDAERAAISARIELADELVNLINVDGSICQESDAYFVTAMSRFGYLMTTELHQRQEASKIWDEQVTQAWTPFLSNDMPALEEKRQIFSKSVDEYESEIGRYCSLTRKSSRSKELEAHQAVRLAKRSYHKAAVDYCELLNDLQSSKKKFFLEKVTAMIGTLAKHHETCHTLFADNKVETLDIERQLLQFRQQYYTERRELLIFRTDLIESGSLRTEELLNSSSSALMASSMEKSRSSSVDSSTTNDLSSISKMDTPMTTGTSAPGTDASSMTDSTMIDSSDDNTSASFQALIATAGSFPLEGKIGYLFKRSSGARKQWHRRWFEINLVSMRLDYISMSKEDEQPTAAVYFKDATIRPADNNEERRFVFQIISNTTQCYLQAECEADYIGWVQAIANAISFASLPAMRTAPNSQVFVSPSPSATSNSSFSIPGSSISPRMPASMMMEPRRALMRNSSSFSSIDSPDRDERLSLDGAALVMDATLIVKAGELYLQKDKSTSDSVKRQTFKTMSRAVTSIFDVTSAAASLQDSIPSSQDAGWKPIYVSLTKDGRLSLFDYDKKSTLAGTIRPRTRSSATKAIATVDLSTLGRYAIQNVHESVSGRRNSFVLDLSKVKYTLAAAKLVERDEWTMTIRKYLEAAKDKQLKRRSSNLANEPLKLSVLFIDLTEAKNLQSVVDVYVEIHAGGTQLGVSATKLKTTAPFWGEPFEFEDIPEPETGLSVVLKSSQWLGKDVDLAKTTLSIDDLYSASTRNEAVWYPTTPMTASASGDSSQKTTTMIGQPEIKMGVTFRAVQQLPLPYYDQLAETVRILSPKELLELSRTAPDLESHAQNLVRLYHSQQIAVEMLNGLIEDEIQGTGQDEMNTLFRANSLATKTVDQYMKLVGMTFLHDTLGPVIRTICDAKTSCEVDPVRLQPGEDASKNWQRLLSHMDQVWSAIYKAVSVVPPELRSLFSFLQKAALTRFAANKQDNIVRYTSVSGFLFLRFFCPAILTPKLFGIIPEHPDEKTRRTLTLITKTLQVLANLGSFGIKEIYMTPMNEYIMMQTEQMTYYLDQVAQPTLALTSGPSTTSGDEAPARPSKTTLPIDLAYELALLHQFIAANDNRLQSSTTTNIKTLCECAAKLDSLIDRAHKMDLATFLSVA